MYQKQVYKYGFCNVTAENHWQYYTAGLENFKKFQALTRESTYAKMHDPVPALQHHLSKMHPFMLQSNPTAIPVTSKNIPIPKLI